MTPRRLTIDVTVARDLLDPGSERHADAQRLFDLAASGDVDLAVAGQGHRLDADGDLGEQLRALFDERRVAEPPQLAYASKATYPADDLYPGHVVEGFSEAWEAVAASGGRTSAGRLGWPTAFTSRRTSRRAGTCS